jgi:uridylate kinase
LTAHRPYKRVVWKLSGEILRGQRGAGFDPSVFERVAAEVKAVQARGVELAVVVGGGNIFRGAAGEKTGIDRATGDQIGMLATVANGLALRAVLHGHGIAAQTLSAIPVPGVVPLFEAPVAIAALEAGEVVIFVAGTGNPYFTTDTAAALRGVQIHADALVKGTKVDGVYAADPETDPDAELFDELTFREVLARGLGVMDLSAVSLCASQGLKVVVYNARTEGALGRVLDGEKVGTIIHA